MSTSEEGLFCCRPHGVARTCPSCYSYGVIFWVQSMGGHSNWMLCPEFDFMIDAGEGAASSIGIGRLAALRNILITHHHWDHVAGLFQVLNLRRRQDLKVPLKIWHPPSPKMEAIKKMVGHGYEWEALSEGQDIQVAKALTVEPFLTKHRGALSFGFKCFEHRTRRRQAFEDLSTEEISRLVKTARDSGSAIPEINENYRAHLFTYTGDSEPLPPSVLGSPLTLFHDATYLSGMEKEAIDRGHSSLAHALSAAKATGAKALVGIHLSPMHSHSWEKVRTGENVLVPRPVLRMSSFEVSSAGKISTLTASPDLDLPSPPPPCITRSADKQHRPSCKTR